MQMKLEGEKKLADNLDKIIQIANNATIPIFDKITDAVVDKFDRWADSHRDTGNMRNSIFVLKQGNASHRARTIGVDLNKAHYAYYVTFGFKPFTIKPKNKKALRWVSGNGFKFAKFVNHPGYKGSPILEPALKVAKQTADEEHAKLIKKFAQAIK